MFNSTTSLQTLLDQALTAQMKTHTLVVKDNITLTPSYADTKIYKNCEKCKQITPVDMFHPLRRPEQQLRQYGCGLSQHLCRSGMMQRKMHMHSCKHNNIYWGISRFSYQTGVKNRFLCGQILTLVTCTFSTRVALEQLAALIPWPNMCQNWEFCFGWIAILHHQFSITQPRSDRTIFWTTESRPHHHFSVQNLISWPASLLF